MAAPAFAGNQCFVQPQQVFQAPQVQVQQVPQVQVQVPQFQQVQQIQSYAPPFLSGVIQQAVQVPQSTSFFAGGRNVAFLNQPVLVGNSGFSQYGTQFGRQFSPSQIVVKNGVFGSSQFRNTFDTLPVETRGVFIRTP